MVIDFKKNIAIIMSDVQSESRYEDDSAHSTKEALKQFLPPKNIHEFIFSSSYQKNEISDFIIFLKEKEIDYVINLCEELYGQSIGEVQIANLLELLHIPFSGSSSKTLALCRNKMMVNRYLRDYQISVPNGQIIQEISLLKPFSKSKIIKPACEDGSFGLTKNSVVYSLKESVHLYESLKKKITTPIMIEDYIEGREINATILGKELIGLSEVVYEYQDDSHPSILTYEAKWDVNSECYKQSKVNHSAVIDEALFEIIKKTALKVYDLLNIKDYGRVDFRVDSNGRPFVIDVNPNPCIAPDSGFLNAMKVNGLNYKKIIEVFFSI